MSRSYELSLRGNKYIYIYFVVPKFCRNLSFLSNLLHKGYVLYQIVFSPKKASVIPTSRQQYVGPKRQVQEETAK